MLRGAAVFAAAGGDGADRLGHGRCAQRDAPRIETYLADLRRSAGRAAGVPPYSTGQDPRVLSARRGAGGDLSGRRNRATSASGALGPALSDFDSTGSGRHIVRALYRAGARPLAQHVAGGTCPGNRGPLCGDPPSAVSRRGDRPHGTDTATPVALGRGDSRAAVRLPAGAHEERRARPVRNLPEISRLHGAHGTTG